tara:strand:- start:1870 stop:2349 length:480 start_codon:yes stop_codon:yes gene_type:complete
MKRNEMYVKINQYYTATVRDLKAFKNHLYRESEYFGHKFGEITYISDECNPRFIRIVKQMIEQKKWELKPSVEWMIGHEGMINVNQGMREYTIVSASDDAKKCVIEYVMPKGTTALRIMDMDSGDTTNMTYKQLFKSKIYLQNLDKNLLIINPQKKIDI